MRNNFGGEPPIAAAAFLLLLAGSLLQLAAILVRLYDLIKR